MATHSSTLAWEIPWMEEPGRLQSIGLQRVGHDFTFTFNFHFHALEKEMETHSGVLAWRSPGTGEPGGLPSKRGRTESDTTEATQQQQQQKQAGIMEKAMAPHSSTLAWEIPWMEEPGRLQSMGSLRVGHDWQLHFHFSLSCIGEGNGNPLQCSCLENPRDGGAWWAAVYGVAELDTTDAT